MARLRLGGSSGTIKTLVVRPSTTAPGLRLARAMTTAQLCVVGINSHLPLQPAVNDFLLEVADPLALGIEHRDLVLELDQGKTAHAFGAQLAHDAAEFFGQRLQRDGSISEV